MDKPLKKNPLSLQLDPNLFQPATEEEKAQQVITRESISFMRDAMRRLRRNKISMACVVILILMALIALVLPSFYPYATPSRT
jgi:oligopeptide transport system permease protein